MVPSTVRKMHILQVLFALIKIFAAIWMFVGRMLVFSWPISAILVAILISEFPHAPKKWECRFGAALIPIAVQIFMVAWAVASIALPILRFYLLGMNLGMAALAVQVVAAAYAWRKCDGYRCFFLALLMNELWVGYWSCLIAGAIIARPTW
jgi:hypothetical protein